MFRAERSVELLQAIASIVGLAILLWSLGLPSLQLATAATLSTVSDTITDSAPSASADHQIEFTHPASGAGVPNGEDIVLDFSDGPFDLTGIGTEDVSVFVDGADFGQANWTLANGGTDLTLTINGGGIAAGSSTVVYIGNNASNDGGSPDSQIVNPAAESSYELNITAGTASPDSATTHVVILSNVLVTASVDTVFTFTVAGVNAGVQINDGGETTTGTTSSTTIPFGSLTNGVASTSAQQLTVSTNASQGYTVTVQSDGYLDSTTGGRIDGFSSESDTAIAWAPPSPDVGDATTWGHWGVTSDDATTTRSSQFNAATSTYIAASTSPRIVMNHNGPANGTGTGVGTTYVGYKVEISALQEAGDDYSTTLTYIATPTF